jgi:type II secretory ATPase GspE/PulE/Tfp pilus assembly ATPase PilB-like protein
MLTGTFNLVMAERLCRKVCAHCKTTKTAIDDPKYKYAKESFKNFDKDLLQKEIAARNIPQEQWDAFIQEGKITIGTGKDPETGSTCPICEGSGYKGRVGLFELMDYTDELKNMLQNGKSVFEIESYALQNGMINLERDGVFKVIKGLTTLDEVYRYVKTKFEDSYTTSKKQ